MILKRILLFIIIFLMGMSCAHFGGIEPYTFNFGMALLFSWLFSGFIAFFVITEADL